jgi:DNA repair exonuclease SbcCD ATPase subunit
MGNSASKKALLEAAEKRAIAVQSDLAARERDLARVEKNLETSNSEKHNASSEAAKLRKLVQDLDVQYAAVDEERKREIERLHAQVRQKGSETLAQQQVSKLRTSERDDARHALRLAQEKAATFADEQNALTQPLKNRIAELEAAAQASVTDADSRQEEVQAALAAHAQELEAARSVFVTKEASHLQQLQARREEIDRLRSTHAQQLEAREKELETLKTAHAQQLEVTQSQAEAAAKAHANQSTTNQGELQNLIDSLQQSNRQLSEKLAIAQAAAAAKPVKTELAPEPTLTRTSTNASSKAKQFSASRALAMRIWKLAQSENAVLVAQSPRLTHQSSMLSVRDFEPATPTPALTTASTPSSSPERASPLSTSISGEKDFSKPVRFSLYPRIGKDLRIEVGDNDEEVMVEIREWHRGVRSFKVSSVRMCQQAL